MFKKPFFTISYLGWMVFVTFSSLYSFKRIKPPALRIPHADKIVHFTFYFVACILGMFFIRELTKGTVKYRKALLFIVISMICYGAIIEIIQYKFTLNRTGDYLDIVANTAGALSGAIVVNRLFSKSKTLKWEI